MVYKQTGKHGLFIGKINQQKLSWTKLHSGSNKNYFKEIILNMLKKLKKDVEKVKKTMYE